MLPIKCCEKMKLERQKDKKKEGGYYLVCKSCGGVHDYRD